jgi:hypothetical protein
VWLTDLEPTEAQVGSTISIIEDTIQSTGGGLKVIRKIASKDMESMSKTLPAGGEYFSIVREDDESITLISFATENPDPSNENLTREEIGHAISFARGVGRMIDRGISLSRIKSLYKSASRIRDGLASRAMLSFPENVEFNTSICVKQVCDHCPPDGTDIAFHVSMNAGFADIDLGMYHEGLSIDEGALDELATVALKAFLYAESNRPERSN